MELLLFAFLAILFQSIFTASETALIRLDQLKIKKQAKEGVHWARASQFFLEHPADFFSIILLCENLSLVAASIFVEKYFVNNFGDGSTIFAIITLSLFSLIIGQYLPKAVALLIPETIMAVLANFLVFLKKILLPVSLPFSFLSKIIYKKMKSNAFPFHRRDIVTALNEIEQSASQILSRLFAFQETRVEDVMIPIKEVFSLPDSITLEQIKEKAPLKRLFTRLPIYKGDPANITYVINLKDIIYHDAVHFRPIISVNAGMRAMPLLKKMKTEGEHLAIVIDQTGKSLGIVTLEDLIEELVGEIRDEL